MTAIAQNKSGRDPFIVTCKVAQKQLAMEDEAYRRMLMRVVGVRSSTAVPYDKRPLVLAELARLGGKPASRPDQHKVGAFRLDGPYAGKLQALWIAGYNLGIISDKSDKACSAFIKRMTKLDHSRWLTQPADGAKAIEALKQWLTREGTVDWTKREYRDIHYVNEPQFRIVQAQYRLLKRAGEIAANSRVSQIDWLQQRCVVYGLSNTDLSTFKSRDWIALMNALGADVRQAKGVA